VTHMQSTNPSIRGACALNLQGFMHTCPLLLHRTAFGVARIVMSEPHVRQYRLIRGTQISISNMLQVLHSGHSTTTHRGGRQFPHTELHVTHMYFSSHVEPSPKAPVVTSGVADETVSATRPGLLEPSGSWGHLEPSARRERPEASGPLELGPGLWNQEAEPHSWRRQCRTGGPASRTSGTWPPLLPMTV